MLAFEVIDPTELGLAPTTTESGDTKSPDTSAVDQQEPSSAVSEGSSGIFADVLTEFEELPNVDSE